MEATPTLIEGRLHDLGDGFTVRRMLPVLQARIDTFIAEGGKSPYPASK